MTANELNMIIEAYSRSKKENLKQIIYGSFYSAYFNIKGHKGLSGSDLTKVLKQIDGNDNNEMTPEEILAACKSML